MHKLFLFYFEVLENIVLLFVDINNFDKYTGFYYHWLYPLFDTETKVYFQLKTVKYADYKLYHFYVSPDLFINFKDPQSLF